MSPAVRNRIAVFVSLFAGVTDLATGAMLVAAPLFTLRLMGVPPRDPVMTSFVGAFVGAVGLAYLSALVVWRRTGSPQAVRETWRVTAIVRLAAGLFSAVAIARGALESGWWSVPAFDLSLAALQLALLRRKWLGGTP